MYWITIASALFLFVTTYQLTRGPAIHRNGQKLKQPPDTLTIFGNAIRFLQPRQQLFDWFVKCQKRFGLETFAISVPTLPPGVVINDPNNLEYVLRNEASITKGHFFRTRSWDLFGNGIINATGDHWKAQRKAGLKFFSGTNLDALIEEVLPEIYTQTRGELVSHAQSGKSLDLQKISLDFTTTMMGVMAYDMDIDASSPFSKAFDDASDHIGLRFQNPLYFITELFTGSKFRGALTEVHNFGKKIVSDARKRRSRTAFESLIDNEQPVFGSLIDSLMETFSNSTVIADAALNFLSAGRDTTAQSLTWTFYLLMRHPEAFDFIHNEITGLITSTKNNLTVPSLQPINTPRLLAVFYESLRLYPPVPFELRQTNIPHTLPDGTFLPPTSIVVWCIWAMNRATEIFGPDANIFRPQRWLDIDPVTKKEKLISKTAYEFPVFNGGPRACLGKKMAELMACWVLIKMLGEFEFEEIQEFEANGTVKERLSQNSLTLPMEGGLPVRVKMRK